MEEKIITVNIRKRLLKMKKWRRSSHAARILREVLEKKVKGKVKFSRNVNEKIWSKSSGNPVSKLRVKIVKVDEKNYRAELVS